jgi:hypothetical protein
VFKLANRVVIGVSAVVLALGSALGVLASWPTTPCTVACAGDNLQGSRFWAAFFVIPLLVSVAAAAIGVAGRFRWAYGLLGVSFVILVVGVLV